MTLLKFYFDKYDTHKKSPIQCLIGAWYLGNKPGAVKLHYGYQEYGTKSPDDGR